MANIKEQKRKAAPTAEAILMHTDERTAIINEHTKLNPNLSYKFHRYNVSDSELARDGYEKVVVDGDQVNHNGDPLVARGKDLDLEIKRLRNKGSYDMVKDRLQKADQRGLLQQKAKPMKPTNNDYE